jgi:hypothetical protein
MLDKALFSTLRTIIKGQYLQCLSGLEGEYGRYTFAIIALWRHASLNSSSRRVTAMEAMTNLSYSGDPGKWKLDFLRNVREVYGSGLTLEHWIMHSAFKSFDGKNQQVQGMIVDDINGDAIQGCNTNFDGLSSRYSQFLATMGSGKPQRPAIPGKPKPQPGKPKPKPKPSGGGGKDSCLRCGKTGHSSSDCSHKTTVCDHCGITGHIKAACRRGHLSSEAAKAEVAKKKAESKPTAPGKAANSVSQNQMDDICSKIQSGELKLTLAVKAHSAGMVEPHRHQPVLLNKERKSNPGLGSPGSMNPRGEEQNCNTSINCTQNALEVAEMPETLREAPSTVMRGQQQVPPLTECETSHPERSWPLVEGQRIPHDSPLTAPAFPVSPSPGGRGIHLSLCDGIGGAALSMKAAFTDTKINRYIAIEKQKISRKICCAANPKTAGFPGVEHGLNGKNDLFKITEEDIASLGNDAIEVVHGSGMCNDFTRLRLLPDRPGWNGPPSESGDPRPGLDGKYGATVRKIIEIIGWVLKYNPNAKYFMENINFNDMKKDYEEVCSALGTPLIIDAYDHSCTRRIRGGVHLFKSRCTQRST